MTSQRTRTNHDTSLRQTRPFEDFDGLTLVERFLEITVDRDSDSPAFRCHVMGRRADGCVVVKDYLETTVGLCVTVARLAAAGTLALEIDDYSARLICLDKSGRVAGIEALLPESDSNHYPDAEW